MAQNTDKTTATIYDVAREAGVSRATVDRVIKDIALVRIIRDSKQMSDPNKVRREGFLEYIRQHAPECRIHTIFIPPHNPEEAYEILDKFFKEHPEVKHITMPNSRIHLMSEYLRRNPVEDRYVVGFDDLDKNIEALNEGIKSITAILPV